MKEVQMNTDNIEHTEQEIKIDGIGNDLKQITNLRDQETIS